MSQKHLILTVTVLFVFFIAANFLISSRLKRSLLQQSTPVKAGIKEKTSRVDQSSVRKKVKRKLVPEDPAKYGIVVQSKTDQPRTQLQWDAYIEEQMEKSGMLTSEKANEVFKEVKTEPEKFDKQVDKLDERIKMLEKKRREDPSNEQIEERLQRLYQIKAIGNVSRDKVTQH